MAIAVEISRDERRRNLFAACAAVVVFGFALGLTYPLLSLVLEARGVSEAVIGLNAAMAPVGIIAFSVFIPVLARRWGTRNVAMTAAFLTACVLVGYKLLPAIEAWFALRLVHGMVMATLFVLSESWVVKFADPASRGKVVAIYGAALSASFGAGPLLISVIGIEGWAPYLIGAGVLLLAIVPMSMVREERAEAGPTAGWGDIIAFVPRAPVLLAAVFFFAVFDAATLSLIPVYGLRIGFDVTTAANMLTVLILGNVVLQWPIGWLADRFDRRVVLAGLAGVTVVALCVLPLAAGTIWQWPALVVMGASGYGIYTVALALLGDRFTGHELIAGAASFATMWGAGALTGSMVGGTSMQVFGPQGLPLSLAVCFGVFLAGMWARRVQRMSAQRAG